MACDTPESVMTLRTAIIGAGTVSSVHLDGIAACPDTTLGAICDIDEEQTRKRAREYGITGYTNLDTMLESESLDWIHVCTPVATHADLALKIIEAGIPLLIEKPVTETVEEYERIADAAETHDVHVSVVHNHNFDPAMRQLMEQVENGAVGEVRAVRVRYSGQTYPDDIRRGEWAFDLPGGEFEEGLPHPLYLLLKAGGYPSSLDAVSVDTHLTCEYDREFTYDGAMLQYPSKEGVLCGATLLPGTVPDKAVEVFGYDGVLIADLVSQTVVSLDRDYEASPAERARNNLSRAGDRLLGNVRNLKAVVDRSRNDDWETKITLDSKFFQFDREVKAIMGTCDPPVPFEEAGWTIKLMHAIRQRATDTEHVKQQSSVTR